MKARGWALLICLLLALPGWGATVQFGAVGGDTTFLLLDSHISNGDSIVMVRSVNDPKATKWSPARTGLKFNMNGFKITMSGVSSGPAWDLINAAGFTLYGGGGTWTGSGIQARSSAAGAIAWRNLNIVCTGTPSTAWCYIPQSTALTSLTLTDVDVDASAYATTSGVFIQCRESTVAFTWNGGSISGTVNALHFKGAAPATSEALHSITLRDIAFSKTGGHGLGNDGYFVWTLVGGTLAMDKCTFVRDTLFVNSAMYIEAYADSQFSARIDSCTFTDTQIYFGRSSDEAQADSLWITNCLFQGDNIGKQCTVRILGAVVENNRFIGGGGANDGGTAQAPHCLLIGDDGGYDVADTTGAYQVIVRNNDFILTEPIDADVTAYYPCVVKAVGTKIYNNTFDTRGVTEPAAMNGALVASRGGTDAVVYNNEFITDDDAWSGIMLSSQTVVDVHTPCSGWSIYNNKFTGTIGQVLEERWWDANTDVYQFASLAVANNCFASGTDGLLRSYTAPLETTFDMADSTWYSDATNFTDAASWRMNWGGKLGLTGITYSAQGFGNVGINTGSPGQPAIARQQPGFRTPLESLESIRSIPTLKGVELEAYIINDQDRANLKVWQFGPHAVGNGTNQQIGNDTLRVQAAFQ